MSAINNGIRRAARDQAFGPGAGFLIDALGSTVAASQAGATALTGMLHRVTTGAATASFLLKSLVTKEAPRIIIVINDGPNTINIYPTVGETMNGVANAALQVAAGATAIIVHTNEAGVLDWRGAAIT
jgi:hypothetical protein